ncbi:MAG: hypothetical protein HRU09_12000 [Oligoflexales bacterium]|nr:hypothetical protein [Oligoflexales bacterium]
MKKSGLKTEPAFASFFCLTSENQLDHSYKLLLSLLEEIEAVIAHET